MFVYISNQTRWSTFIFCLNVKSQINLIMEKMSSVCSEVIFKKIFDEHANTIRNFIYYKCGNMDLAEDITQDTFIKLWENCSKVVLGKAKSFIMKIAQNAFINETHRQKVILNHKNELSSELHTQSPEFLLEEKEFLQKLKRSIAELPEKQREVFLLNRIDKKKYWEIAEIVGISQKGVERRMHLALRELRKKVGSNI